MMRIKLVKNRGRIVVRSQFYRPQSPHKHSISQLNLFTFFKFSSFLRSTGCVTLAIRMCASSCKLSAFYDQIFISYRFIIKPTF